jgi:lipopolysaccharide/colanic/teichoic acid biosynthesis glycosyltransferase
VKRAFDMVASAVVLVIGAPLYLCIALLVRIISPGPVLFRQTRVGRGGQPFTMFKFRTMRASECGPQVTGAGDVRVTSVGRFLRRTKLDELPEFFNVLRGEMSIVGPRPEVPRYVELWPAEHKAVVLSVRPGITDPATVRFRNEEDILSRAEDIERAYIEEMLPVKVGRYREYIENASLLSDTRILIETVLVVVFPSSAGR